MLNTSGKTIQWQVWHTGSLKRLNVVQWWIISPPNCKFSQFSVWFASLLLTNRQEKSKLLKKKPTFNTHKGQRKKVDLNSFIVAFIFLFLFFAGDTIFQCKRPGLTKRWTTVLLQIAKRRSEKQEFYHPRLWKYVFSVLTYLTNEYSLKHVSCLNSLWNTDKQVIILESRWPFSEINWNCTWNTLKWQWK